MNFICWTCNTNPHIPTTYRKWNESVICLLKPGICYHIILCYRLCLYSCNCRPKNRLCEYNSSEKSCDCLMRKRRKHKKKKLRKVIVQYTKQRPLPYSSLFVLVLDSSRQFSHFIPDKSISSNPV